MNYKDYLKSKDWIAKRTQKLREIGYCQVCHATKALQVHHLQYKNLHDVKMNDLMVLCKTCHFIGHDVIEVNYYNNRDSQERFNLIKDGIERLRGFTGEAPIEIIPKKKPRRFYIRPDEKKAKKKKLARSNNLLQGAIASSQHSTSPGKMLAAYLYGMHRPLLSAKEKSRLYSGPCKVIYSANVED